jgi:rSAM/selenodomain-associated transferase 1
VIAVGHGKEQVEGLMVKTRAGNSRSAVAIMAKAPQPGQVKTRLCPPLSHRRAAQLYQCFLCDKIAQVNALPRVTPAVSYSPPESQSWFKDLTPPHFMLLPQYGDDLGARLLSTFEQLFQAGYTEVLVIDSDTPTLPTAHLEQALSLFAAPQNDVVLGPTEDGGYYLIGLRRLHHELFERMPWSTPQVFRETRRRSAQCGLTVACTESWYDVDTPEDLARLMRSIDQIQDGLAGQTRRFLQGLRG